MFWSTSKPKRNGVITISAPFAFTIGLISGLSLFETGDSIYRYYLSKQIKMHKLNGLRIKTIQLLLQTLLLFNSLKCKCIRQYNLCMLMKFYISGMVASFEVRGYIFKEKLRYIKSRLCSFRGKWSRHGLLMYSNINMIT